MTDKTIVGILTDKAMKEGKSGDYFEFRIKAKEDKYPQTYRFFPKDDDRTMAKAVHKEETVEATFWEKESTGNEGQTVLFKNILTIKKADVQQVIEETVGQTSDDPKAAESTKEQRLITAVDETMKIAVLVRERWKTEFLQNEDMKDIPPEAKIATLNSLLIQVFKRT